MRTSLLFVFMWACLLASAAADVGRSGAASVFPSPSPSWKGEVKIWISLRDKGPGTPSPRGSRAFEDYPVHAPYVEALRARGLRGGVRLKWQNLVSGYVPADSLPRLKALPFVAGVALFPRKAPAPPMPFRPWVPGGLFAQALPKRAAGEIDYGANRALAESLRVDLVHARMAREGMVPGKGVTVAVIDADFHIANRIFDSVRTQGRILDQYDFVDGDPQSVDTLLVDSHGASCTSLIGGNLPGTLVGMAPGASFLLYRAEEDAQERYVEEDYVAAAIERAVDSGAQVISISLGYRTGFTDGSPDLPFSEFDGRHRPSSIAAAKAAGRNVLVSVAVGNEDGSIPEGPTLGAPADADSILAVGIVNADRERCSYSCTGPSADGRVKPDVVSMGLTGACSVNIASPATDGQVFSEQGTSFAAPAVAGVAALLRQLHPEMSAMRIRESLMKTAGNAAHPDSLVGYGLIDAWAALGLPAPPAPAPEPRVAGLYHQGGRQPLILPWSSDLAAREITVTDLRGRNIPVTVRSAGKALLLDPDRDLRTGVYLVRVVPVRE
jgi:serine protease AprX